MKQERANLIIDQSFLSKVHFKMLYSKKSHSLTISENCCVKNNEILFSLVNRLPPSPLSSFFCDAAGLFNWYRCFYFQRLRELMSPVCRILLLYANQKTKFVEVQNISKATKKEKMSLKNILSDLVVYLYFSIFS